MQFVNQLETAGDYHGLMQGPVGPIEVAVTVPHQANRRYVAMLGHPHSLQGGTMNNKVVTTLVRVFKELGIVSVRFNFRGVGRTAGHFDAGLGESEDMCFMVQQWLQAYPDARVLFAGFSFGSYVCYRAAVHCGSALLVSVAPPVQHFDFTQNTPSPWIIVQGDEDDVVSPTEVALFAKQRAPLITLMWMPNATHFFHGLLIPLKNNLLLAIRAQVVDL